MMRISALPMARIARVCCDGVVEVAYEDCGVRLYGGADWWDIMVPGATNGSNLARHNDGAESINPKRQREGIDGNGALTRNRLDAERPYLP